MAGLGFTIGRISSSWCRSLTGCFVSFSEQSVGTAIDHLFTHISRLCLQLLLRPRRKIMGHSQFTLMRLLLTLACLIFQKPLAPNTEGPYSELKVDPLNLLIWCEWKSEIAVIWSAGSYCTVVLKSDASFISLTIFGWAQTPRFQRARRPKNSRISFRPVISHGISISQG